MGEFEEKLPSLLGERLKTVFKNLVQMHRSFTGLIVYSLIRIFHKLWRQSMATVCLHLQWA